MATFQFSFYVWLLISLVCEVLLVVLAFVCTEILKNFEKRKLKQKYQVTCIVTSDVLGRTNPIPSSVKSLSTRLLKRP